LSFPKPQHFWRTLAGFVLLAAAGPLLCAIVLALRVPAAVQAEVLGEMRNTARLQAVLIEPVLRTADPAQLRSLSAGYGATEGAFRLTLLAADGRVLSDSDVNPDGIDNLLNRPEFQLALSRGVGEADRFSNVLQRPLYYVAVPVGELPRPLGFLRLGVDGNVLEARAAAERAGIWMLCLGLLALMLAPACWLAWRRIGELQILVDITESLARGEFERRVMEARVPGHQRLAAAVNQMARYTARRVSTLTADRNRLATIFTGMVEGVIDVDQNQHIIHINEAAAELTGVRKERSIGKPVWQELRHQQIIPALDEAIRSRGVIRLQVEFVREHDQLIMDVYIASLADDEGNPIGAVLVLHDITDLKRLERVRTDFVANASHELKTPITAIRGLSETVVGDPDVDRDTLVHFMERVHAQSIRLSQLVTDLLTISRLEADQGSASFTRINMNELVNRAAQAAETARQHKQQALHLTLPEQPLQVFGDRQNLSQLVDNLVDNAIKYTPEKGRVALRLTQIGDELLLEVEDSGIGIAPQHQERVFERFYRVDKARSQSLGGTGLGLSIVRNIAERHGGSVSVRSQPGSGSTFSFRMPLAASSGS